MLFWHYHGEPENSKNVMPLKKYQLYSSVSKKGFLQLYFSKILLKYQSINSVLDNSYASVVYWLRLQIGCYRQTCRTEKADDQEKSLSKANFD